MDDCARSGCRRAARGGARGSRTLALFTVLALAAVLGAACSSGGDGGDGGGAVSAGDDGSGRGLPGGFGQGPATGPCRPVPAEAVELAWLPADLPLPDGTYAVEELPTQSGLRRAILAIPVSYGDFASFALEVWPTHGWLLGRGETELGEAETSFIRDATYGAFRARNVYCGGEWSELLLAVGSTEAIDPEPATTGD